MHAQVPRLERVSPEDLLVIASPGSAVPVTMPLNRFGGRTTLLAPVDFAPLKLDGSEESHASADLSCPRPSRIGPLGLWAVRPRPRSESDR